MTITIKALSPLPLALVLAACATDGTGDTTASAQLAPTSSTATASATGSGTMSGGSAGITGQSSSTMGDAAGGSMSQAQADRLTGTQMDTGQSASGAAATGAASGTALRATTQAEALALVAAVDEHEIRLAEQARSKKVTGDARAYADMMVAHHTPHLAATRKLAGNAGTSGAAAAGDTGGGAALQSLQSMSQQAQAQLAALQGDAYARAYIDRMVLDHQMALQMLDASMSVATDAKARNHLTATRRTIQQHLDRARELQAKRGG